MGKSNFESTPPIVNPSPLASIPDEDKELSAIPGDQTPSVISATPLNQVAPITTPLT